MLQRIVEAIRASTRIEVLLLVETNHGHLYLHRVSVCGGEPEAVAKTLKEVTGLTATFVPEVPALERDGKTRQYWVARGQQPRGSQWVGFTEGPAFSGVQVIPHRNLYHALKQLQQLPQ